MRIFKYLFKIIIFNILSINPFNKIYYIYFNLTAKRRRRYDRYYISSKKTIEDHIFPEINNLLMKKEFINLLDVGCGPDIFNNIIINNNFKNKVKQELTDKFPSLNSNIYNNSFQYLNNNTEDIKEFFNTNFFRNIDLTKVKINKPYDIVMAIYVIEHFNKNEINFFLNNIKHISNNFIFIINFTDEFFSDKWTEKNDKYKFQFLKYSDIFWKLINNQFLYQSRKRMSDYKKLFLKNDYKIIKFKRCDIYCNEINQSFHKDMYYQNFKINDKFKNKTYEDLYTPTGVFFLSRENA